MSAIHVHVLMLSHNDATHVLSTKTEQQLFPNGETHMCIYIYVIYTVWGRVNSRGFLLLWDNP